MKRGCLLNSIADFTQISYGIYSILVRILLNSCIYLFDKQSDAHKRKEVYTSMGALPHKREGTFSLTKQ